ncbi:uncharacterized protein LOC125051299 [Pieris napi]|uniref:uncharacterized protein LOC125051299 n=1 Tax=Pieris napi TaxID=78633 RepID=UPI001FB91E59|nr:uncharacterized protein LOC125051299 [Pieris napi]
MKALAELNFRHKGKTKLYIAAVKNENINETPKNYLSNVEQHKKWRWNNSKYYKGHDRRLKRFVPVHSKYLFSLREKNKDSKAILRNEHEDILHSSSADIISIEERSTTPKSIEFEGGVTEKNWIKAHKNFNNIQINDNAPEYLKLIPKDSKENIRSWWFFSQHDFKEFSGERKV